MVAIICVHRDDPERPSCRWAKDFQCRLGVEVNFSERMFYCEKYEPEKKHIPVFLTSIAEWLILRLGAEQERDTRLYKTVDLIRFWSVAVVVAFLSLRKK